MKRKLAILLVCSMAAGLLLTGCGNDTDTDTSSISSDEVSTSAEEEQEENRTVSTEELLSASDYDIKDYVTLPENYADMTIDLEDDYEPSEVEIRDYIETYALSYYPVYEEIDKETVEEGDYVEIGYVGTMDGEEFSGGSNDDQYLEIGSGDFIDGFEDGLIGHKKGDVVELDLVFPDDYSNTDYAGKDVHFSVTIKALINKRDRKYTDLDDEFIEENMSSTYNVTTLDEFHDYFEQYVTQLDQMYYYQDLQAAIFEKLEAECEITIPDSVQEDIDASLQNQLDNLASYAEYYDEDEETFIQSQGYDSVAAFTEEATASLTDTAKQQLIMEAIVADRGTTIETDDFYTFINNYLSNYGSSYGFSTVDDVYSAYGGKESTMLQYAENCELQNLMAEITVNKGVSSTDESEDTSVDAEEAEETE